MEKYLNIKTRTKFELQQDDNLNYSREGAFKAEEEKIMLLFLERERRHFF